MDAYCDWEQYSIGARNTKTNNPCPFGIYILGSRQNKTTQLKCGKNMKRHFPGEFQIAKNVYKIDHHINSESIHFNHSEILSHIY